METEQNIVDPSAGTGGQDEGTRGEGVNTGSTTVNVQAVDQENIQVVGGEGAAEEAAKTFDLLRSELGDIEEMKVDGVYSQLTADHIRELDPVARRIVHNMRVAAKIAEAKAAERVAAAEKKMEERTTGLRQLERDLTSRHAQFLAMAKNPEIQKFLAISEEQLADPLSEKGMEQRIQRGVAQGLKALLEPMQQSAAQEAAKIRLIEFIEAHPEMKDPAFKKEVADLIKARAEAKSAISTPDAFEIVKGRRLDSEARAKADAIARARAESAQHVQQRTVQGSPGGDDVPRDIVRRGAGAVMQWLRANPQAAARIAANN